MHPRGCNGLHAICKCVGQVAFQRFLRIPLVTTLPPIFFARFVRLTLAEWTFQSWLALGRRFKEEYYYYYYWKFIKLRMYYWNLRRMFSTSCKLWFQIFYNSEEKGKKNFQFDSSNRVFGDSPRSKNRCIAFPWFTTHKRIPSDSHKYTAEGCVIARPRSAD